MALFLEGCGVHSYPTPSPVAEQGISLPFPEALQKHTYAGLLKAEIVVDGGGAVPLIVDLTQNKITGEIGNVASGEHVFVIRYYLGSTLVATATKKGIVTANATTVLNFLATDILYVDDDQDGFTNLAELDIGTNHLLASSRPSAERPRFSKNYVVSDTAGISPVGGVSTSTNYNLTWF